ncbi:hypothetical protein J6Q66_06075 [bacterium]|nr:hypothetical protein [bacterium]
MYDYYKLDKGFAFITGTKNCIESIIESFFVEQSTDMLNDLPNSKYVSIKFEDTYLNKSIPFEEISKAFPECEIVVLNECNRYGTHSFCYKPIGESMKSKELITLISGHLAFVSPYTNSWVNLFVFDVISYARIEIVLKNGKKIDCIVDDISFNDDIKLLETTDLDLEFLAEICSKSVAERSRPKYLREFFKTIKTSSDIVKINIDVLSYRKKLTTEEANYLSDESITEFAQTYVIESVKRVFDYEKTILTTKQSVQVIAMKNPEDRKYNLETNEIFSQTTQTTILK